MSRLENVLRAAETMPWAIAPDKLAEVCALLELRVNGGHLSPDVIAANTAERRRTTMALGGAIAVIPVQGVIAPRMDLMTEFSGGTSCEQLGAQIRAAVENPQVSAIVLDVNSPGGNVQGVQELSEKIRAWRDEKQIIAVSNHQMASAAYCIGSAASEVVAAPSSEVGSIGVFCVHSDVSQSDAVAGVKRTLVKAGIYKAEDLPFFPLSDDAKQHMQAKVDDYYAAFVGEVAANRGTTVAAVRAGYGQGQCLTAKAALAAGLVDRIATLEDVINELSGQSGTSASRMAASAAGGTRIAAEENPGTEPVEVPEDPDPAVCPDCDTPLVDDVCPDCGNTPPTEEAEQAEASARPALVLTPSAALDLAAAVASTGISSMDTSEGPQASGRGGQVPVTHIPVVRVTAPQAKETYVIEETTAQAGADDNAREREITEMSALAADHAMQDQLPKWIAGGAKLDGPNGVRAQITASLRERLSKGPQTRTHVVDMTAKEEQKYSYARAIASALDGTPCFERDLSEEMEKKLPQGYQRQGGQHSLIMPTTIRAAGLDTATSTKGQELKFVTYGGFIDMLRNKARVIQAGARMLSGLDGPVTFAKQNGAGTFAWVAENGGSDVSESNLLLTTVSLTAKTGSSTTSFSRQLLRQGVEDAEGLIRNDLAAVHALGIDAAALYGTGSSNQPTGVYNTSGVGVVALGTNGAAPTYAAAIGQQVQTGQANADEDIGAGAYITTPGIKGTLQTTLTFPSTAAGAPVWSADDMIAGRKGYATNQVQSTLTKGSGSNLHAIYYGIWQQLLIGEWGAMEILVDPLRLKKQGMIEVTSFQMIDIAVRYAGAFSLIKDAISTF